VRCFPGRRSSTRSRSAGCWFRWPCWARPPRSRCGWCCRWRRSLLAAGCWLLDLRSLRAVALVLLASCTLTGLQVGSLNPLLFVGLALCSRLRAQPGGRQAWQRCWWSPSCSSCRCWCAAARPAPPRAGRGGDDRRCADGRMAARVAGRGRVLAVAGAAQRRRDPALLRAHRAAARRRPVPAGGQGCIGRGGWRAAGGAAFAYRRGRAGEPALFASAVGAALLDSPVIWSHYSRCSEGPAGTRQGRRRALPRPATAAGQHAPPKKSRSRSREPAAIGVDGVPQVRADLTAATMSGDR